MWLINGIKMEFKRDFKAVMKMRLTWRGVLSCMVACAIIGLPLIEIGRFDLFMPTYVSIGMLATAIAVKWRVRRCAWFWITIAFLAALHVPLILFVPWTTKWVPARAIAAVASADLIAMLVILDVVYGIVERPGLQRNHRPPRHSISVRTHPGGQRRSGASQRARGD